MSPTLKVFSKDNLPISTAAPACLFCLRANHLCTAQFGKPSRQCSCATAYAICATEVLVYTSGLLLGGLCRFAQQVHLSVCFLQGKSILCRRLSLIFQAVQRLAESLLCLGELGLAVRELFCLFLNRPLEILTLSVQQLLLAYQQSIRAVLRD